MAFSFTSRNIRLDGTVLRAECLAQNNAWHHSELRLHRLLENSDGSFKWMGRFFHRTAQDVYLNGSVLHAHLYSMSGELVAASVDLDERITNDNGQLKINSIELQDSLGPTEDRWNHVTLYGPPHAYSRTCRPEEEAKHQRVANDLWEIESRRVSAHNSLETCESHQYRPLSNKTSIRLLKISPATDTSDLIDCSLIEADLKDCPPFAALSYTWKIPFLTTDQGIKERYEKSMSIRCNGQRLVIGQNLYDALRRLRRKSKLKEPRYQCNKTDLIYQAERGYIQNVERLLRNGADFTATDVFGETALHYAAENGHIDCVKALVYAGSDINAIDNHGRKPLECARQGRRRWWKDVEEFLLDQLDPEKAINAGNSSLQNQVVDVEYFWIDAISMNQSDLEERSAQVAMMGDIYQAAKSVIVWLGPEYQDWRDTTEDMLRGAWRLEGARTRGEIDEQTMEKLVSDPVGAFSESTRSIIGPAVTEWLETFDTENMDHWSQRLPLFRRSWFGRSWVLQEAIMAKEMIVVYGPYRIPWDTYMLLSSFMEWYAQVIRQKRGSTSPNTNCQWMYAAGVFLLGGQGEQEWVSPLTLERQRRLFRKQGKLSMMSALSLSSGFRATDARDKIFSLLSFASFTQPTDNGPQPIVANYTHTTEEVYTTATKGLLQAYGPCILSLSGKRCEPELKELPSWVPDFRARITSWPNGIDLSQTEERPLNRTNSFDPQTGTMCTGLLQVTAWNELCVSGTILGTITDVAHTGLSDVGTDLAGLKRWEELLSKLEVPTSNKHHMLRCALIENDSLAPSDHSDVDFKNWLTYVSVVSILGLQEHIRACLQSDTIPNITFEDVNRRPQSEIQQLYKVLQSTFAALGIPMTEQDDSRWTDPHTYECSCQYCRFRDCGIWEEWKTLVNEAEKFENAVRARDVRRRLLKTEKEDMLGTGPELTQEGDVICAIRGATVPYVLREVEGGRYRLVGEAYVYGIDVANLALEEFKQGLDTICIV